MLILVVLAMAIGVMIAAAVRRPAARVLGLPRWLALVWLAIVGFLLWFLTMASGLADL